MKKYIKLLLCILLLSFSMIGCSNNTKTQVSTDTTSENSAVTGTIHFTDDEGREVNLDSPCTKIISLYSGHTENLYYLGAGASLIGGYKTCVYPPEAAFLDMYDYSSDPEKIIAANPDCVLIRPFITEKNSDFVSALENAGILVVSLYAESYSEFDDYIDKLAMLTGTDDTAEQLLSDFHSEIEEITSLTADMEDKQTIFFESTETNLRTVTPESMPGLAITFAGGINLAADAVPMSEGSSISEFGDEKILANADNIDVYVSQRGSMNSGGNLISISERPGFDTIKAVKENRVFTINEKLISSPSFRYVKGVRELARFMYPDVMDNISKYKNDNLATKRDFSNIIVRSQHIPIYLPTSSKYYQTEQKGHSFGLFEDVTWQDEDFDYIETAVYSGYVEWTAVDDKEYFYPEANVTRDELAKAVFVMGDFKNQDANTKIADLGNSDHSKIVQIMVDNGVFALNNGKFEPDCPVTNNEILEALSFLK